MTKEQFEDDFQYLRDVYSGKIFPLSSRLDDIMHRHHITKTFIEAYPWFDRDRDTRARARIMYVALAVRKAGFIFIYPEDAKCPDK